MDNIQRNLESRTICLVAAAHSFFLNLRNGEAVLGIPNGGRFMYYEMVVDILAQLIEVGTRPYSNEDQLEICSLMTLFALASIGHNNNLFV
uniref:Uncharacterized protein n=1 Tax=Caenorhabditis tropicalis TaxID=1561998 RepID=A0A1I7UF06_9PELO